jgi:hypothetical protein
MTAGKGLSKANSAMLFFKHKRWFVWAFFSSLSFFFFKKMKELWAFYLD